MIGATATTLRFPPTSNSGPWWPTELKSPASKWHPLRDVFQFKKSSQLIQKVPMKTHRITRLYLILKFETFSWSFTSVLTIEYLDENLLYMTKQALLILGFELDFWKWHVVISRGKYISHVQFCLVSSPYIPHYPFMTFSSLENFADAIQFSHYSGTLSCSPPSYHSQG